jgi:hypothetical protein
MPSFNNMTSTAARWQQGGNEVMHQHQQSGTATRAMRRKSGGQ